MSTEIQPEDLPTIFDPETCVKKGLCPVTTIRAQGTDPLQSHSLYYEQHGTGTKYKVLFIMGLNSSAFAWLPQAKHFGRSKDHTVLVFDNRGVGNSGYPRGPYTTSGMAEDAIALLDYFGWKDKRDVHVVGISLGGMIAQELATRIPERIASLVLAVTTPGGRIWQNFPPLSGLKSLLKLMTTPDVDKKVPTWLEMLFPVYWLDEVCVTDPKGRTNRQVQAELFIHRVNIAKPQRFLGHISQMCAALTHHVTPERLRAIDASIPKIVLVTGDLDNLVAPRHTHELKAHMDRAELVLWEKTGHGLNTQSADRFNGLVEKAQREGRELSSKEQERVY